MISLVMHARPSASDADERRVLKDLSYTSALGALADRVVLNALRIQSGDTKQFRDDSASEAAGLLEALATEAAEPVRVTQPARELGALTFLKSNGLDAKAPAVGTPRPDSDEIFDWLRQLIAALKSAHGGTASKDELVLIVETFTRVAELTLSAASEVTRHERSGDSWTMPVLRS
jgi:hypothetical protein